MLLESARFWRNHWLVAAGTDRLKRPLTFFSAACASLSKLSQLTLANGAPTRRPPRLFRRHVTPRSFRPAHVPVSGAQHRTSHLVVNVIKETGSMRCIPGIVSTPPGVDDFPRSGISFGTRTPILIVGDVEPLEEKTRPGLPKQIPRKLFVVLVGTGFLFAGRLE